MVQDCIEQQRKLLEAGGWDASSQAGRQLASSLQQRVWNPCMHPGIELPEKLCSPCGLRAPSSPQWHTTDDRPRSVS